jgi:hypothetical protein
MNISDVLQSITGGPSSQIEIKSRSSDRIWKILSSTNDKSKSKLFGINELKS